LIEMFDESDHSTSSSARMRRDSATSRELLRDFQVDKQLKLGRLLDRQVRRFCTLEDSFDVKGNPEIQADVVRA
jgi:hypothetical protein